MHEWIFDREYRVTFRDSLTDSEKITKGKWSGEVDKLTGAVFISIEERYARNNNLKIGDTMIFNVQGSVIPSIVGSFRKVDGTGSKQISSLFFLLVYWRKRRSFMYCLPVFQTKEASARFQRSMVKQFPKCFYY
jgi:putative ABC transport system permease protein